MAPRTTPLRPLKRRGFWYLSRRVPKQFRALETREVVQVSTGIRINDDPLAVAAKEASHASMPSFSRGGGGAAGEAADPQARHDAAVATARAMGLTYAPVEAVAAAPVRELVARLAQFGDPTRQTDHTLAAVLGTVAVPSLTLSRLREAYEKVVATELREKSTRQLKRWRDVRDHAVEFSRRC